MNKDETYKRFQAFIQSWYLSSPQLFPSNLYKVSWGNTSLARRENLQWCEFPHEKSINGSFLQEVQNIWDISRLDCYPKNFFSTNFTRENCCTFSNKDIYFACWVWSLQKHLPRAFSSPCLYQTKFLKSSRWQVKIIIIPPKEAFIQQDKRTHFLSEILYSFEGSKKEHRQLNLVERDKSKMYTRSLNWIWWIKDKTVNNKCVEYFERLFRMGNILLNYFGTLTDERNLDTF